MTVVVILPGMDGSGSLFTDFISALAARCIVVSYPPDRVLGYAELEELVRVSLPTTEQFIIVGESFSGPIAIALASTALPGLRAVVLVCTFARLPGPRLPSVIGRLVGSLPFWRAPASLAAKVLLGRFASPSAVARLKAAIRKVSPAVWRARLRGVLTVDATRCLPRIHVPMLYLRATEDRVVARSASEEILRGAPTVKLVEIDAPHFLLQAKPSEAAAAITEFASKYGVALSQ